MRIEPGKKSCFTFDTGFGATLMIVRVCKGRAGIPHFQVPTVFVLTLLQVISPLSQLGIELLSMS